MAPGGATLCVNVQGHEGELMKFSAWKDDKVWKIKEQIMSEIKVPVENQKLFLGSETLNPEKKLSDYGIDPSSTIHLILKVVKPSNEEQMVPQIKVDKGKKDPVHVEPSGSVSQVKEVNVHFKGQESMKITAQQKDGTKKINEKITAKTKEPIKKQMLLSLYRDLNPETKLSDNSLGPSPIHLKQKFVYPSDEEVQVVFLEVNIGKKHTLFVRPSTSVSQFIELIKSKAIVPPKGRVMYFNDKALQCGKVMSDYLRPECNVLYSYNGCIGG